MVSELLPPFRRATLALVARIRPVVDAVVATECGRGRERFVATIDMTHLTKSPESVVEKMARKWDGIGVVPITFRDIPAELTDLGRFRIVTNFLSDATTVCRALEAPYAVPVPSGISTEQRALFEEFRLRSNAFEDLIHVPVEGRRSAERCYKAVFEPCRTPNACVEVQVQTLLQESWDKKEHVLIYEPARRGEPLPQEIRLELEAMSDLLFVVDRTFDRLRSHLQDPRA